MQGNPGLPESEKHPDKGKFEMGPAQIVFLIYSLLTSF